ncbi:MAG: DUF4185 domain-containing protein [Tannerella sp.]|jgi:hypothetical protein|nr:DUF4185 domain-containing protein [Tannerella sp.]
MKKNSILLLALAIIIIAFSSCNSQLSKTDVKGIQYGMIRQIDHLGDTWIGTWADDGHIYSVADDCSTSDSTASNLALFRMKGDDPLNLELELINPMSEYGAICQLDADSLAWKASGITCIDGILYMFVSRHDYPWRNHKLVDNRQTACDGSIIKSIDHGKTWTRTAEENTRNPMFPGRRFASGFFIEYGKDGKAGPDDSDKYVYAVANDGFWNNGSDIVLGRCFRSKLPDLNKNDWEFYKGDGKKGNNENWSQELTSAVPVLTDSTHIGMSTVTYLPHVNKYILAQWYFPTGGFCGRTSIWSFREADAPWGTWETFSRDTFAAEGFYNPGILTKFVKDDGFSSYITVAGDCFNQEKYYKLHLVPFRLLSEK